jgi:hypothetical protein
MTYGGSSYGLDLYGGSSLVYNVVSATATNPYTVILTFSEQPDLNDPETLNPANYYIDVVSEGTVIGAPQLVAPGPSANTIKLVTPEQEYVLYRVSVNGLVVASNGSILDPEASSADFTGSPGEGSVAFRARAIRQNGINLVFTRPMLVDAELADPANYTVIDIHGGPLPILSAVANKASNASSVVLSLGGLLTPSVPYTVHIDPAIKTSSGLSVIPPSAMVIWTHRARVTKVPFSVFSKEVKSTPSTELRVSESLTFHETVTAILTPLREGPQGFDALRESLGLVEGLQVTKSGFDPNISHVVVLSETITRTDKVSYTNQPDSRATVEASLSDNLVIHESLTIHPPVQSQELGSDIAKLFGDPDGLVFFSPALIPGGAPNSSIQVDEVKTCTTAYDTYSFPQPVDPQPLYTHGGGLMATPSASLLNTAALFVEFYRMAEAKHTLRDTSQDAYLPPVDISATMVLREMWPPARVALLNSTGWTLFDGLAPPPYDFITADNLSPFPPPTSGITNHFVNPSEALTLIEGPSLVLGTSSEVVETIVMTENFDLTPGENVVQVNVSESMSVSDAVSTHIGINLFETLAVTEGVVVSI